MTLRTSIPAACGLLLSLGLVLVSPRVAIAAEVMCSNADGECTISNDGQSWISCNCGDLGGTGGTGGDDYEGLTEAELLELCEAELAWCADVGGEGGEGDGCEGGSTSGGTDGGSSDGGSSDSGSTDGCMGEEGGDPTDTDTGATTVGEDDAGEGDPTDGNSSDSGETGGAGEGEGEGDGDGDGDGDGGAEQADDEGGETGSGETGPAANEDEAGGCSVTTHSGFGVIGLALLGLFGIHRRERRQGL